MTKKQIRQRLIDIHAGAGRAWIEGDGYFDVSDLDALQRAQFAVRDRLLNGKHDDHYLFTMIGLDYWDDFDKLTDVIYELLK